MWSFFKKESSNASSPQRELLAGGSRIYAIGDVHGCFAQLDVLVGKITADLARAPISDAQIVLLGDYVDRGPDTRGVLHRLAAGEFPLPIVALRGNHEEMLISFLSDPSYLTSWRHFGGLETLHSFGIDVRTLSNPSEIDAARERLLTQLPPAVLDFLESTRLSYDVGEIFFCHAGIRPGVPLNRQSPEDLLWIRDEFLGSAANHGKLIVHGHSPVETPDVRQNRINVDTGAYLTGKLTAAVIEGASVRFLST